MSNTTPLAVAVLIAELIPAAAFGLFPERVSAAVAGLPRLARLALPTALVLPYLAVVVGQRSLRWQWLVLYTLLPVIISWLVEQSAKADPGQRGNWRDALILLTLGVAVDLRWFDAAWPRGLEALGKLLLVDAGLYGFVAIRRLEGTGFDLRLRWTDWKSGLRELAFFAPVVLALGWALGFLHPHRNTPSLMDALLRWVGIFLFVAIPEELFFRGWVQNLLERRMARPAALMAASVLFGLSHFNKRSAQFNWRYVLLATIAGIFYGRAWRERRRIPASTITHTFVDWLWSWWF